MSAKYKFENTYTFPISIDGLTNENIFQVRLFGKRIKQNLPMYAKKKDKGKTKMENISYQYSELFKTTLNKQSSDFSDMDIDLDNKTLVPDIIHTEFKECHYDEDRRIILFYVKKVNMDSLNKLLLDGEELSLENKEGLDGYLQEVSDRVHDKNLIFFMDDSLISSRNFDIEQNSYGIKVTIESESSISYGQYFILKNTETMQTGGARKCGICRSEGHNARTCPQNPLNISDAKKSPIAAPMLTSKKSINSLRYSFETFEVSVNIKDMNEKLKDLITEVPLSDAQKLALTKTTILDDPADTDTPLSEQSELESTPKPESESDPEPEPKQPNLEKKTIQPKIIQPQEERDPREDYDRIKIESLPEGINDFLLEPWTGKKNIYRNSRMYSIDDFGPSRFVGYFRGPAKNITKHQECEIMWEPYWERKYISIDLEGEMDRDIETDKEQPSDNSQKTKSGSLPDNLPIDKLMWLFHSSQLEININTPTDEMTHVTLIDFYEGGRLYDNFDYLESSHNYIQWFFPGISNSGSNKKMDIWWEEENYKIHKSPKINDSEIAFFIGNVELQMKGIKLFNTFLRFLGFKLKFGSDDLKEEHLIDLHVDAIEIVRLEDSKGELTDLEKERLQNLNDNSHNYSRIDRILSYLGILGLNSLKKKWMVAIINEFKKNDILTNTAIKTSMNEFWFKNFPAEIEIELKGLLEI